MADIVLAQIGSQTWLVDGEAYLDDLLANTLPDDVTIEFIACQSESEIQAMWHSNVASPSDAGPAWLIHPAIAERARRAASGAPEPGMFAVEFAAWSAMHDDASASAVAAALDAALARPAAGLVLTQYIADPPPPMAEDLARLRSGMLEAEFIRGGVAASRIERATAIAADAAAANRITVRVAEA